MIHRSREGLSRGREFPVLNKVFVCIILGTREEVRKGGDRRGGKDRCGPERR